MEGGEGMVAVVRGLRDSGLAVTLLDGSRQYTLMPNAGKTSPVPQVHITQNAPPGHLPSHMHIPSLTGPHGSAPQPQMSASEVSGDQPVRCDSGSQATDGRYASMYKMAHCSVTPTSPPVQLTEFPPQRAELYPGHGNFEVGGSGSGEHYVPCRANGCYRGGMSWPDRGSVCSPRPSREPDAFANSLRKYPNLSVERSTEMVERLITYTQAKNMSKNYQNRYPSPSRHGIESNTSNQLVLDRSSSRNTVPRSCQRGYEPEVRIRPRGEESPTRDLRPHECDCTDYRRMAKADSRCLNVRKVKDLRSCSYTVPYNQQSPRSSDRYDHNMTGQKTPSLLTATNSVNMEVQAAAEMVSREVATVPGMEPVKRTVAVPLSRTSSDEQRREGDVSHAALTPTHKSVETSSMPVDLSVQTTSSNINTSTKPPHRCRCFIVDRKSKSEEKLKIGKELSDDILDLLDKVSVCPNADPTACDLRREVLKQMSDKLQKMSENIETNETKDKIGNMLKYVPIWVPCGDVQSYRDAISDEIISKMNHYKAHSEIYRAETQIRVRTESNVLEDLLRNVIGGMPIKTMDIFGKPLEKNRIVETYVKRVKRLITNIYDKTDENILKSEILVLLSKIPIAISTHNKITYLNKLVESLMNKLKTVDFNKLVHKDNTEHDTPDRDMRKRFENRLKKYVQPTEEELKEHILDEVEAFLEKYNLQSKDIKEVETELIDILIDSIQDIILEKDENVANEIMLLLLQTVEKVSENQAKIFIDKILSSVRHIFNTDIAKDNNYIPISGQSCNIQSTSRFGNGNGDLHKSSDLSIGAISKGDIDSNLDSYMNQLIHEIDQWLEDLELEIPRAHEAGFREVVVNDLAGDIIDRHKYLELNPSCKGSDEDELEHLKYQIFKWINKLVGVDNTQTIEKAADLMNRIQNIPVPMLTELQQDHMSNNDLDQFTHHPSKDITTTANTNCTSQVHYQLSSNKSNVKLSTNTNQSPYNKTETIVAVCCSGTPMKLSPPSMKQLNEEYDGFLKKWVQDVPMPSSNPKEIATAEKARLGLYNGIWKAITKLKFEPATFHNPFYYEDALDDELEELLSLLPKTPELETKKHLMKVQLIEKTTNTNDLIKSVSAPASFKQQLVDSVSKSLPPRTRGSDYDDTIKKLHEEQQILKLVENFILCTKYKEEDKEKANIYRKRLIKEGQTLVNNLKKSQGQEYLNIDSDVHINSILNALQKVPLPDAATVQDEAEEILLGHEVDQWLTDLPIVENNDGSGQLQRKKLKDALLKKIREIEKEVNIFDCTGEKVLKHEISNFLGKVSLEDGEDADISFMAEEFANRMKNRARQLQGNAARKSVAFMDSVGYLEFSRQIPLCSSFSNLPEALPAVRDQSSLLIRGGDVVKDSGQFYEGRPQNTYQREESFKELPSDQYFTMQDSQAPKQDSPPRHYQPEMQNMEWKSIPMATASSGQNSPERQRSPCCRNASSPQRQSVQNANNSAIQGHRISGVADQYPQGATPHIPNQALSPCCRNKDQTTNESRVVSPIRQRQGTPRQSIVNPDHSQGTANTVDSYRTVERSVHDSKREMCRNETRMNMQGVPSSVSYGEPQGFSTPQQVITQGSPQRPGRKRIRNVKNRKDFARKRLELEDDTEEDLQSEDELCPCERMYRCRRRPVCYAYDDFEIDGPQCYPISYGCPYFY